MRYSNPAQLAQLQLGHNAIDTVSVLMGAAHHRPLYPPALGRSNANTIKDVSTNTFL